MLSLLVTLLILLVIFAIFYWILSVVPIPPQDSRWIVKMSLLGSSSSFASSLC